jgi:hypothetical protein
MMIRSSSVLSVRETLVQIFGTFSLRNLVRKCPLSVHGYTRTLHRFPVALLHFASTHLVLNLHIKAVDLSIN